MTRDIGARIPLKDRLLVAAGLVALVLVGGNLSGVSGQGSGNWAIPRAQEAVRQQIVNQERQEYQGQGRSRNETVRFNNDARTDGNSNSVVRVTGTGSFSGGNRTYQNGARNRDFRYEALVTSRGRNRGNSEVSEVRYDWRDGMGDGRGRGNNNDGGRYNDDGRGRNNNDGRGRPEGRLAYTGPIVNRHSDKGLDVAGGSQQDGANVQQWSFTNQPNQTWNVIDLGSGEVAIISQHSGLALTVQGGRDLNGANIIQRNWNANPQQRWRLEDVGNGYFRIVSVDNGKVLDVSAEGRQDGANIQLWDWASQANQQWRLKR